MYFKVTFTIFNLHRALVSIRADFGQTKPDFPDVLACILKHVCSVACWNNLCNITAEVLALEDVMEFSAPSPETGYFAVLSAFCTSLVFPGTLHVGRLSTGQYLHADLSIQHGACILAHMILHLLPLGHVHIPIIRM